MTAQDKPKESSLEPTAPITEDGSGSSQILRKAVKQLEECQCAGSAGSKLNSSLATELRRLAKRSSTGGEERSLDKSSKSGDSPILDLSSLVDPEKLHDKSLRGSR